MVIESSSKPNKERRRSTHPCGIYIRRVKGSRYQLRWYIPMHVPGGGNVNCGLYPESTANQVRAAIAAETVKQECSALGIWRAAIIVLEQFRARGFKVPDLMPKYVRRAKDGSYFAQVRLGRKRKLIVLKKSFPTPEQAHWAMLDKLKKLKDRKRK